MIGDRRGPVRLPPSLSESGRRLLLSETRISVQKIMTKICPDQVLALVTTHLMEYTQESKLILKLIQTN